MKDKPLFVPLKSEFFDAFAAGTKTFELRRYGARWNERVCRVGRDVTLSRGYGKRSRLSGRVRSFTHLPGELLSGKSRSSVERTFGTLNLDVAIIGIELTR